MSKNKTLPYPIYFWTVFSFTVVGLFDTGYLAYTHYLNYTDIAYSSFCAISKAINCDTVAQSPWSILLGVPVAIWGVFGYLLFLCILIALHKPTIERMYLWSLLFILALFYSLSAVAFGTLSAIKIQSFCLLCIISYTVSFSLLFSSWIIRRRFPTRSLRADLQHSLSWINEHKLTKYILLIIFLSFFAVHQFLPEYWNYSPPENVPNISSGVTDEGHPWIGAERPRLTIEEYSDYQCFQCYKTHFMLRRLISEHPGRIRLVHRNYPMDHEVNPIVVPEPFHVGSGRLALAAIAASFQNKFWPMNDALYKAIRQKTRKVDIKELAVESGLDEKKFTRDIYSIRAQKLLKTDIHQGWKHTVTGTPSFVINNQVYTGFIPPEILEEAIRP